MDLSKVDELIKKVDELDSKLVKILKVLGIRPMTLEEATKIQKVREHNENVVQHVYNEAKKDDPDARYISDVQHMLDEISEDSVYSDVIADDFS